MTVRNNAQKLAAGGTRETLQKSEKKHAKIRPARFWREKKRALYRDWRNPSTRDTSVVTAVVTAAAKVKVPKGA